MKRSDVILVIQRKPFGRELVVAFALWMTVGALNVPISLASPPSSTAEQQLTGTVQPPKLIEQIKITYPAAALKDKQHGDVSVLVTVDTTGKSISARFESGPPVFEAAAIEAASELRFKPATRSGKPVTATTRVWFHFAPPEQHLPTSQVEIIVHASHEDIEDTRSRETLEADDLERASGDDLAQMVSQVAGVSMAKGTADASKPIIRGQQERRLLVLYDGIRHESQKWGPDHATEIDPFSAGSISVIRGAAGARYGPDAIGGVILVEPPPMRTQPGVGGKALTSFSTNGMRPYAALRLDAVPSKLSEVTVRAEGNVGVGASQNTPTYVLGNTASRVWNTGTAVEYRWGTGHLHGSWHHHDFEAGVFYGVRNSTPEEFQSQLALDRPVTADLWTNSYTIDRPFQSVTHDVAVLQSEWFGAWGSMETKYAFQHNRRKEYEQVRDNVEGPQFDFKLRTHSMDILYAHPSSNVASADLSGGLGLQGSFQENVFDGLSLIPNFRSFSGGVFAHERLSFSRVDFAAATRFDALSRSAFFLDNDFDAHVRRKTLEPSKCEAQTERTQCPADYQSGSVSLGMLAHVVPDLFDFKLDLSTANRFPNVDELYLLGSSPSFPVYANGYPDLGVETVWGGSMTGGLRTDYLEAETSVYSQLIKDYVYFAPQFTPDGDPRIDVTIRGAWPTYSYQPIDAVFHGLDGMMRLGPNWPIGLDARGAMVRARNQQTKSFLIGTPPDQVHVALVGRLPPLGDVYEHEVRLMVDHVAKQTRVEAGTDFAPPPPAHTLLSASIEATIGRKLPVRAGIDAHNLLNTRYREYTSLLRYYADQPGRDIRVRLGMDF